MAIVTGDRYLDALFKFVEEQSSALLDGTLVLKLNPVGLHYVQSRIEQLQELESLLAGAPVDYLRAYISDLGDHRALEQLRRILRLLTSLKVVSVLPPPARDPTPISLLPFGRLKVLELRGCDLSTSAARGLLELRHTLEKLICHNSTDALRHVFASRIMDIKESPTWHKLAFVSCACNGLVLMDESLQLLPSVETLDLSRNRFAKVDNLRRCTKLRHLDLGFNHIRSVASLSEVSYHHIVKLVLRNNALTTLRGIENLTSIEGLDLSYNIISNFSELEFLGSLVSLKNLWLEGNPICCARWYRPQVFSYFSRPQELSLDEKEISTRETWKRQIILASRQKQPPGYGFYSPAKVESEQGSTSTRRKMSRLAFIEEEHKSFFGSDIVDLESVSCDSVYMRREENSDGEAEIASLMNKIECMKKERSVLWLRELKEWIDQTPGDRTEDSKLPGFQLINEKYRKSWRGYKLPGENSSYAPDLVQDSGDESSTNFIESDTSFTDSNIGFSGRDYIECSSKAIFESPVFDGIPEVKPAIKQDRMDSGHKNLKATQEELSLLPFPYTLSGQGGDGTEKIVSMKSLTAIDEIMESRSSSIHPGSPPHYQEDILHRRHNWEEEFLQFSAESFSLPSSDSDTSCDDDSCKICTPVPGVDQTLTMESTNGVGNDQYALPPDEGDVGLDESDIRENGSVMLHCSAEQSSTVEVSKPDAITPFFMDKYVSDVGGSIINGIHCQDVNCVERKRGKKKPKKRVVSLSEENLGQHNDELPPQARNVVLESDEGSGDEGLKHYSRNDFWNLLDRGEEQALTDEFKNLSMHCVGNSDMANSCAASAMDLDEIIKNYFDENAADAGVPETCLQCIVCHCILQQESGYVEKEVALVRSSAGKLYVLLVDASFSGRGNKSKVLGCHRLEDIKEVVFGIGLQILRLYIEGSISYLFITRNIEKSRGLLSLLQVSDSSETSSGCRCSIRSWEQVQIRLFEDSIRGGMKMSIFQYSMLLFWHNRRDGESWLSRSLFVIAEHVLVCSEDILQFCAGVDDLCLSSPYFSLDSCCSICSISEMVIESKENKCLTMSLDGSESSKVGFLSENEKKKQLGHATSSPLTWKLKWFSEDAIFKFVALIKAIHLATTMSSLPIKCIS